MECLELLDRTLTHHTLKPLSPLNLVSIFRCPSPPHNLVYARRVDPSVLSFSVTHYTDTFRLALALSIKNKQEISQDLFALH